MQTALLGGLVIGSIYVIVALGYNLTLVGAGAFNFAQGAIVMLGTMLAYQFGVTGDLPPAVVILLGAGFGLLVGLLVNLLAIRTVQGRGSHGELVTTVGASIVIEGVAILIWGDQPFQVKDLVSPTVVDLVGGRVTVDGLALIAVALLAFLGLWGWSRFTLSGLSCLAMSEDRVAAALRGINVRRMSLATTAAAGAIGAAVGPAVGPTTYAVVTLGTAITLKSFLALAIGGFGSFPGALVGGFSVGIVESVSALYLGASFSAVALFAVLLLVLLLRPTGLFGSRQQRVV
ncbi:branched-chain amino acid ABC transporter permease [Acrocarpospora catenulata]|uniref:branched-chain amino acid ABC transporter permease n=1 Tax=Acrocarpospora catenulata TaxID=2836182 RepID=UPI001BDA1B58|nr:branched-chain amino acid ABC transporter permease [Acrocarpospora catenulata]